MQGEAEERDERESPEAHSEEEQAEAHQQKSVELQIEDHITDLETVEFWRRYFDDIHPNDVKIEEFCDAVQSEFYSTVIVAVLDDNPHLDEDALVDDLFAELRLKLCIDDAVVSLNALELFTRPNEVRTSVGLKKAIGEIVAECALRQKMQQTNQINDTIVSELQEVKQMLD